MYVLSQGGTDVAEETHGTATMAASMMNTARPCFSAAFFVAGYGIELSSTLPIRQYGLLRLKRLRLAKAPTLRPGAFKPGAMFARQPVVTHGPAAGGRLPARSLLAIRLSAQF
jgi:hypothetical protein